MEAEDHKTSQQAPPSIVDDWHLVDAGSSLDGSSDRAHSPACSVALEEERPTTPGLGEILSEAEERMDGLISPQSEKLADSFLAQPFTPSSSSETTPPAVEERQAQAVQGDSNADCAVDTSDAWSFQRERIQDASRVSQEGALDGFADSYHRLFAVGALNPAGLFPESEGGEDNEESLSWDCLWASMRADLATEWNEIRAMASATARGIWAAVQSKTAAMADVAAMCQQAVHQRMKLIGTSMPLWVTATVSSLAVLAVGALAAQVMTNKKLVQQLRQRDRELARLVVKILQLQDALQSAVRPQPAVLRHMSATANRYASTTLTAVI